MVESEIVIEIKRNFSRIKVFLKNNSIVKILPKYNSKNIDSNNQWISDKTRFCFDGMFSQNRNLTKIKYSKNILSEKLSWNNIFKDLITSIYFIDHLVKHSFKIKPLFIVYKKTVSIEKIKILLKKKKKYSFFELRRAANLPEQINDFETNIKINNLTNSKMLK